MGEATALGALGRKTRLTSSSGFALSTLFTVPHEVERTPTRREAKAPVANVPMHEDATPHDRGRDRTAAPEPGRPRGRRAAGAHVLPRGPAHRRRAVGA